MSEGLNLLLAQRLRDASIRHYFANLRKDSIISRVKSILETADAHGFKVLDVEPRYFIVFLTRYDTHIFAESRMAGRLFILNISLL